MRLPFAFFGDNNTSVSGNEKVFPAISYANIQAAIDAAHADGGGLVRVSQDYAEKITLKSNVYVELDPGVTLSYTGAAGGNVISSPGNDILENAGVTGYGAFIDMGTDAAKGIEVVSAWNCSFKGLTFRGTSTTSFMIDVRGDASGGSNLVGGRHTAWCVFTDLFHEGSCGTLLRLDGTNVNSGYITLNNFSGIDGEACAVRGYDFAKWCDNNYFDGGCRVALTANNAVGAEFNTADPTNNVGVYSISFASLAIDTFTANTGRVGVKLNNCKDIYIHHLFQDPQAEGGVVVVAATTGSYRINWFDDDNALIRVYTKANQYETSHFHVRDTATPGLLPATAILTLESTDAGADGPCFVSYHNSASPAANDTIFRLRAYGKDSAANDEQYAALSVTLVDPTSTSEDARWSFNTVIAGTLATRLSIGAGAFTNGLTDQGAGTINAATLYENNTSLAAKYGALASANTWTTTNTFIAPSAAANNLVLQSNDAGTIGPLLAFLHNSASPAVGDLLLTINGIGLTSLAAQHSYGQFQLQIADPTSGSTDAQWIYNVRVAGAQTVTFMAGDGLLSGSASGGMKGVGTVNATGYWANNNLAIDSNALIRHRAYTVGTLPSASGITGAAAYVTDASAAPVYNATAAGGGSTFAKVVSDGTNWRYA